MHLSCEAKHQKLDQLGEIEGHEDLDALLQACVTDSVSPGICVVSGCDYSTEVEPDQREGWCENCRRNSVQSALVLAGRAMPLPKLVVIDGRTYAWRDILKLRREQRRQAPAAQPYLFELRNDARPTSEQTAAGRYLEPSLFSALEDTL